LRHLSPEQKRQRKIELQRDWQRLNKKKIPKARKAWLRKFREKFLLQKQLGKTPNKPLFRKTLYQCAVCLYRVGFDSPTISKKLNLTNGSVRAAVFRAGVRRKLSRQISRRFQNESALNQLIVGEYRREAHALKRLDESYQTSRASRSLSSRNSSQTRRPFKSHHQKSSLTDLSTRKKWIYD
jgi:hypothetical protein